MRRQPRRANAIPFTIKVKLTNFHGAYQCARRSIPRTGLMGWPVIVRIERFRNIKEHSRREQRFRMRAASELLNLSGGLRRETMSLLQQVNYDTRRTNCLRSRHTWQRGLVNGCGSIAAPLVQT